MYINLFKSAVTDEAERIKVNPHTRIKDIPELKDLDFLHVLIYVNGFQKNANYILREKDVVTIRCFPASAEGFGNWVWGGISWVQEQLDVLSSQFWSAMNSIGDQIYNTASYVVKEALAGLTTNYNYYTTNYDQRSYDYSTTINNTIINADNVIKSPNMRGCSNQLETGQPFPLVIGKSYFVPRMCAKPYITPSGDYGYYQTYHALFDLGYGAVNVTNISLGLKKLATNVAKQRNGAIVIDGDYDSSKYDIHLEIQETNEVSLYDQMVVQQDINAELLFPKPAQGETPRNFIYDGISTPYPQKVELEFYFEGLVGKVAEGDNKGKDCDGTVKIKCEYSTDGGVTFHPFGQIGNVSGISYNSSTGETTITMKNYHSMRLMATKVFSASEVFNATNHVVELRIQRTTIHDEDLYIYDTVSLASVRTYTYDPELSSSSTLVKQAPVCAKDRQRITRLGVTITSNERLYNLQEFNCIVQALGRTCTESSGYYTWSNQYSETCNPASMALRVLQCGMLGEYVYTDSEIDMQKFGEFYKFCDEYDINDASGNHVGICANGVITKQTKLSDLLSKILAVGRASRIIRVGKLSLYIDKPIEYTSLILNNQNVLSASNSKNFDELPSGVKCGFVNEDNFNQEDVMYIDYSDAPARTSPQYKTIAKSYEFQTNVEQIKKNALYDLAVLKLRPETWTRKVTSEGCLAFIGAKIEVQDDTIAVGLGDGAEIKDLVLDEDEEYITGIKTDGEFDVTDTTQEYGVRIQVATIQYGLKYITRKVVVSQTGVYRNFTFDSPISLDELILPAKGDILSFGVLGKICYESICIGKKADSDGTFELTLVPYVAEIYTADSGTLPEFESNTTAPNYYTPPEQKPVLTQEDLQKVKNNVIDIENGTATIENPDTPTGFTAVAERDGIQLTWNPLADVGLKNVLRNYTIQMSTDGGTTWDSLVSISKTDYFYTFRRTGEGAEGYPEASFFDDWEFRIKAENVYGKSSEYAVCDEVNTQRYGTWIIPNITASQEVLDRTAIIKVVYATPPRQLYGNIKTQIRIKRLGNTDEQEGVTFNDLLGITPDATFKTPEFNKSVQTSATTDNEPNYRDTSSNWYTTDLYQFSHTLPLIGQTARIFKEGNVPVKDSGVSVFTKDVVDYSSVPQSPTEGLVIHYTGDDITGFVNDGYYLYENSAWVRVYSKSLIVPTTYEYQLRMINESGESNASSPITVDITALCTNIADIVHSHEHYKDLYVEKLSAISANIGLITQGGMGSFQDFMNYWALSDLSPEDSGVAGGVKKGAFRVGGQDQYFKVTPIGNNQYEIELKAGNITLTSSGDGTSFKQGTYIYDSSDEKKRLALTASGIIAQKNTSNTSTPNWVDVAQIKTDAMGNLIITNEEGFENTLPFGFKVNGSIYHFDDIQHPTYEEGTNPTNPQGIVCTGNVIDTNNTSPILYPDSSKKCFEGEIDKDISQFTGNMVLFSKSDCLSLETKVIKNDGTILENNNNVKARQETAVGSGVTYGSIIGLSQNQIDCGVFAFVREE